MKKRLICALLALLLCAAGASAEDIGSRLSVYKCNSYITLREEPDKSARALTKIPKNAGVDLVGWGENGFLLVAYRGQTGYALEEYLRLVDDYEGDGMELTRKQRYNLNLFLSNFTEQGFLWRGGCYDESWIDSAVLTRFAVEHCWFNRQNRLEWGDYFNYNNVRLPKSQVAPIVKKYFGVTITPSKNAPYLDYKNDYYYWEETGGHVKDGFACLTDAQKLSSRRYSVWFEIYGAGEDWDNDVCYYTPRQAEQAYPSYSGSCYRGHAVINTGSSGQNDRSDWHIERYTVDYGD